jgi:hypothetical protein
MKHSKKCLFTMLLLVTPLIVFGTLVFSVERGYFDSPFIVTLSVSDPDAKIYYTTDGMRPTEQSSLYIAPIPVAKTTPLSATSLKNGIYSPVVTQTYFFISDIVTQSNNRQGYPDRWGYLGADIKYDNYAAGERAPADYAMDPNICNHSSYKNRIKEAFLSIPSLSIVTNPGYLFSESTDENEGGIYIHTGVTLGHGWERPVSIEYYEPATGKQFQINSGLRLHGAASRQPEKSGKHSFRTIFRKIYGEGKLKFDLFNDETAVTKFDHLVFRATYNLSWLHPDASQRNNAQYIIDSFAKRTQRNMGHPSAHDRFAHLYLNGIYWGIYNISERIGNKFMAAYFDGEDVDYDVVNHDGLAEGNLSAWNRMIELAKAGNYDQLLSEKLLCVENFIDYMLLNFYIGNQDWPHNNWYAVRDRLNPGDGFRFFSWDAETSLVDVSINRITGLSGDFRRILFGSSTGFSETGGLYNDKEFLLLFTDRVHRHFFNGGCLAKEKTAELYEKILEEIDFAIILESARWGDYRKNTLTPKGQQPQLYTRDDHWLPRKESLLKDYFPKRSEKVYKHLQDLGLTSPINPPVFSSYGEEIDHPIPLSMSADDGTVYYTIDGTDPRQRGGKPTAFALAYTMPLSVIDACTIKARAKNGQVWSALSEATFTRSAITADKLPAVAAKSLQIDCTDNALNIVLPEDGNIRIEIYSITGKCLKQSAGYAHAGYNREELPELSQGIYICKIIFNAMLYQSKFII